MIPPSEGTVDSKKVTIILVLTCAPAGMLGLTTRHLFELGLTPIEVSFLRQVITVAVLFAIMAATNRKAFRVSRRDLVYLVLCGAFKLSSDVCLFFAQEHISLAMACVLQNAFPYYVMVGALFLFKEKITPRKMLSALLMMMGLILVTGVLTNSDNLDFLGVMAALFSGVSFAVYMLGGTMNARRGNDPQSYVFYCFLVSALISLPLIDVPQTFDVYFTPEGFGYSMLMGIAFTVIPMFTLAWSVKYVDTSTASIISSLEVVTSSIVGLVAYNETMSLLKAIGIAVVMVAMIVIDIRINAGIRRYKQRLLEMEKELEKKIGSYLP